MAKKSKQRFNLVNELYTAVLGTVTVTKKGEAKIKRSDLKAKLEEVMMEGAKRAIAGERVRIPVLGSLASKEVKARKAGKGTNPFTGEPMTIKARAASKKPRMSFNRALKDAYANKKNW